MKVDVSKSENMLSETRTCFNELVMPSYSSFEILKVNMDKALLLGCKGFTHI